METNTDNHTLKQAMRKDDLEQEVQRLKAQLELLKNQNANQSDESIDDSLSDEETSEEETSDEESSAERTLRDEERTRRFTRRSDPDEYLSLIHI